MVGDVRAHARGRALLGPLRYVKERHGTGALDAIVRAHEDALRASPDWADVQSLISGLSRTP